MVVRIPATLIALGLGLALDAGALLLARMTAMPLAPIVLLPLAAITAGFVAGRWGLRPPPVPGFAVGLFIIAIQIGLAFGSAPEIRPYAEPGLLLLQVIAAMAGGRTGALLARRAAHPAAPAEPEFTPLS
jgi:hypothetical protein